MVDGVVRYGKSVFGEVFKVDVGEFLTARIFDRLQIFLENERLHAERRSVGISSERAGSAQIEGEGICILAVVEHEGEQQPRDDRDHHRNGDDPDNALFEYFTHDAPIY